MAHCTDWTRESSPIITSLRAINSYPRTKVPENPTQYQRLLEVGGRGRWLGLKFLTKDKQNHRIYVYLSLHFRKDHKQSLSEFSKEPLA